MSDTPVILPTAPPDNTRPDQVHLALERTYLAHERTLMAWVRTSTSLIAFGFTLYQFFFYLHEREGVPRPQQLFGPRTFGLVMIGVGRGHTCDRSVATPTEYESVASLLSGRTVFALLVSGRASRDSRRFGLRRCPLPAVIQLAAAEAPCTSGSSMSRSCSAPALAASRNAETACSNNHPDNAHRSTGSSTASASSSSHPGNSTAHMARMAAACSNSRPGSRSSECSNPHDIGTGAHIPAAPATCANEMPTIVQQAVITAHRINFLAISPSSKPF